ncbi:cyanogenic beta-glucosidase [Senna tora]|uniref:Cyanogenic beta-glucosidase n=1 Tax=Senna tora TaxID=362788 RepID=A0A834SMV3_9FABA|nr:cyanogenic beta-glucosidase [Senna tora]
MDITNNGSGSFNRSSFPEGFIFGASSSAYQFEGAAKEGGKGTSIWDVFTHKYPEKIKDRSNGDVATDQYHRYKEDVALMKEMNLESYRLSISWTRILPNGKLSGGVNREGINYYNNLINELLANGIEPMVTLFHWDLPQRLEEEYGGFLSPKIINDFVDYAELCFKEFGDRVRHWITINEAWTYSVYGYAHGDLAPGRCSPSLNLSCLGGDSGTEPYTVAHHFLLSHASVVNLYRTKFQASQKGEIGIALVADWAVPASDSLLDFEAAQRAHDFMIGWFLEPLVKGRYPKSMRDLVGQRLPKFSRRQRKLVIGSYDFIGLNHYSTTSAAHAPQLVNAPRNYLTDSLVQLSNRPETYSTGIRELLLYINSKYNNPTIYITENGMNDLHDSTVSLEKSLADTSRVDFLRNNLYYLNSAIKDGVNVKGYYAWSFLDNFEWSTGHTVRFGLVYVDYNNNLERYPKFSARWFQNFLRTNIIIKPAHDVA